MEVCIVPIILENLKTVNVVTQIFDWYLSRIGLSYNFKVLQWIKLNESFRNYFMHYEILKKFVRVVSEIYKKSLKVQILMKLHLGGEKTG